MIRYMVYDQSRRNATIGGALAGVAFAWALASMAMLVPAATWLVGMVQFWALLLVESVVSAFAGKASGSGGFILVPAIHTVSFPISQGLCALPFAVAGAWLARRIPPWPLALLIAGCLLLGIASTAELKRLESARAQSYERERAERTRALEVSASDLATVEQVHLGYSAELGFLELAGQACGKRLGTYIIEARLSSSYPDFTWRQTQQATLRTEGCQEFSFRIPSSKVFEQYREWMKGSVAPGNPFLGDVFFDANASIHLVPSELGDLLQAQDQALETLQARGRERGDRVKMEVSIEASGRGRLVPAP